MSAHARVCIYACMILTRKPLVYVRVRMHRYALAHLRNGNFGLSFLATWNYRRV